MSRVPGALHGPGCPARLPAALPWPGSGVGALTTGALPAGVWEVAGGQRTLALAGGGETTVGRSSSGSRQTTWRRWSAQQPWSRRGR